MPPGATRISVIVCTYEAPRELDLVLCGLARQTRMPDDVVIADDGSGPETKAVIESWQPRLGTRLVHAWHVDNGFRKSRISNEAVRRASGDFLVFLDGDSIPHRRWMEDHAAAARPGRISCGRRVKLSEDLSARVDRDWIESGRLESLTGPVFRSWLKRETTRYPLGVRLPRWAARLLNPRPRRLMGVNFGLSREAFERVNGYDEEPGIIARIDAELELRLLRCGYELQPLLQRAVVYHLHHPVREGVRNETTLEWWARQQRSDRTRCELGYDSPFDPDA